MTRIERLLKGDTIIYVAGRLFDIEEKIKSETLEAAVLAGVVDTAATLSLPVQKRVTFVPFRDTGQEDLAANDKTRRLFELDLVRLRRTDLLVSYIDGLAKDEGVCFEIGYAYAFGAAILLISTDFYDVELPNGQELPFDPLLCLAATRLIRRPRLAQADGSFRDILIASRAEAMAEVRRTVKELLIESYPQEVLANLAVPEFQGNQVFLDFGGPIYEWQELMQDKLEALVQPGGKLTFVRSSRYNSAVPSAQIAAAHDLATLVRAGVLVSCTDGDEAPAGTAFLQGVMCALGRPIWMYNSKRTALVAAGGYRMSRNLMLDYSATRVFRTLDSLAAALQTFVI